MLFFHNIQNGVMCNQVIFIAYITANALCRFAFIHLQLYLFQLVMEDLQKLLQ